MALIGFWISVLLCCNFLGLAYAKRISSAKLITQFKDSLVLEVMGENLLVGPETTWSSDKYCKYRGELELLDFSADATWARYKLARRENLPIQIAEICVGARPSRVSIVIQEK